MQHKNSSYEEMVKNKSPKIYEESEVASHNVPAQNDFELNRNGSNGLDQSGMK